MKGEDILKSSKKFRIELGLDRMEKILEIFNHPEKEIKFIHVAGTNGKGSVCTILETILTEAGYKTGKYTSPHLFNYTERFSINRHYIDEDELENLILKVTKKDEEYNLNLTEFEILTAVCFLYFKKEKVDYAILETGLGGRFDATNVVKNPILTIITSISKDHTEKLGNTIEKIAYEKAGIFKKGSKAIFLKTNKGYKTLLEEAKKTESEIIESKINVKVEKGFAIINKEKISFNLNGSFQAENLALAIISAKELQIPYKIIKKALPNVRWKFRMEEVKFEDKIILLDACHNPDGARVLDEYIKKYYNKNKIKFIFGCLQNKDYNAILNTLYNPIYDFCFYEFDYPNALKFENIKGFDLRKINSPIEEIEKKDYDICVVSGSIYMLGTIFKNSKLVF